MRMRLWKDFANRRPESLLSELSPPKMEPSGLVLVCISMAKRGLFSAGINLLPVCSAVAQGRKPKDPSHIPRTMLLARRYSN